MSQNKGSTSYPHTIPDIMYFPPDYYIIQVNPTKCTWIFCCNFASHWLYILMENTSTLVMWLELNEVMVCWNSKGCTQTCKHHLELSFPIQIKMFFLSRALQHPSLELQLSFLNTLHIFHSHYFLNSVFLFCKNQMIIFITQLPLCYVSREITRIISWECFLGERCGR